MTERDQIIAWAREAGGSYLGRYDLHQFTSAELQALIRIVAAHEREQCARVCEEARSRIFPFHDKPVLDAANNVAVNIAAAIRGRADEHL